MPPPRLPIESMNPAVADAIEANELALTADLDDRLAGAGQLDAAGAELLGYDVRKAGRKKHRDVQPYPAEDPRAAAYARGAAAALAEIDASITKLSGLIARLGRDAS